MTSKSILITGCSTGIGLHTAKVLHDRGYQVFATVRAEKQLNELKEYGIKGFVLDVCDELSMDSALNEVLDMTGGKLDGLFNNAGYGQPGAVEDLPSEALRAQFETNVIGAHNLTRKVIPIMRAQGHGRLLFNSSVLGVVCMPYRGAYNASKFALEGLVDTLRLELMNTAIQVSILEPGPIESCFRKNAVEKLREYVDLDSSVHAVDYQTQLQRLEKKGPANQFTLGPEAVTQCVIHAMESRRAKIRYRITFPTKLFSLLKRILPVRLLDQLLVKG